MNRNNAFKKNLPARNRNLRNSFSITKKIICIRKKRLSKENGLCLKKRLWYLLEKGKNVIIVTRAIYMLYLDKKFLEYLRLPKRSAGSSLNLTQYEISIGTANSNFLTRANRDERLK